MPHKKPAPLPPTPSPILNEAITSLLRKVGAYVVDPIVELRLYGGQR
jgi:hypothetical protein